MSRGIVFRESDGGMALIIPTGEGGFVEQRVDPQHYDDMPDSTADIVEVEHNETLGMDAIHPLYSLSFAHEGTDAAARDAIRSLLRDSPGQLVLVVNGPAAR